MRLKEFKTNKGFYIGDICYVLTDTEYDEMWALHEYKDGKYTTKGHDWAVYSTAYGDGVYDGGGYNFCVDAGVIGIMPLELITDQEKLKTARKLGFVIEGELFANFKTDSNGYFDIEIYDKDNKSVEQFDIDTQFYEYEDEDEDEEEWD